MNRDADRILARYKDADFNQRLNMYMQFRELRAEFLLIEQCGENMDWPLLFPQKRATAPGVKPKARLAPAFR